MNYNLVLIVALFVLGFFPLGCATVEEETTTTTTTSSTTSSTAAPTSTTTSSTTSTTLATVATPTFVLASGSFEANTITVTIECPTPGATIYFTTDGTTPSASATRYSVPLTLGYSRTIKAVGVKSGYNDSAVSAQTYDLYWWQAVGTGLNNVVNTLVYNGSLYAGGQFNVGVNVGAARWNGSDWVALGSGLHNNVFSLAFYNDQLFAGGQFTVAGGGPANYLAFWNGSAWEAMASEPDNHVDALKVNADTLYIGGAFTTIGAIGANRAAQYNGGIWSGLSAGMTDGGVLSLACDPSGIVYAGGSFTMVEGGTVVNYIAKHHAHAVWNGVGGGMNHSVYALIFDAAGNLYAGGSFTTAGGELRNRLAKWDGTKWSALGSGMNEIVYALAFDTAGNLYAGGAFTTAGGVNASKIAKWDGSQWSAVGTNVNINGSIKTLTFDSAGNLYAGGSFTTIGEISNTQFVAKWGKK